MLYADRQKLLRHVLYHQWRRGGVQYIPPTAKFWAVGTFLPNNAKFGAKTPILGKFRGKIEILSTHNLLCWRFAAVCRKIATFWLA